MSKPIHLYSHATGPNPWKVVIFLEELGLPYETEFLDFGVMKSEPFVSVNPNGRVPAIKDPNTGITLWEVSGGIGPYVWDRRLIAYSLVQSSTTFLTHTIKRTSSRTRSFHKNMSRNVGLNSR